MEKEKSENSQLNQMMINIAFAIIAVVLLSTNDLLSVMTEGLHTKNFVRDVE